MLVNADAGSPDGTGRVVVDTEPPDYVERILLVRPRNRLQRISLTYPEIDGVGGKGAALRTIFRIADALGVQALVVVDSDLRSIVPEWVELLAGTHRSRAASTSWRRSTAATSGTAPSPTPSPIPFTRALYGLRIRQPIGGDFGVSGDLVRHYLAQDDWTPDVSKFGIDIWMTTTAITGGFAVCQTRLGAKVHDPKDPGADLGPMFSQVVGTLLRLTDAHAKSWLAGPRPRTTSPSTASSATPTHRRSTSTWCGCWTSWRAAGSVRARPGARCSRRETAAQVETLAAEARARAGCAVRAPTPRPASRTPRFAFPDELWARIVGDVAVAAHRGAARRRARAPRSCRSTSGGSRASSSRPGT